jgi:hypothetical protein
MVKRALQAYERIYEDLLVPASFTIPEGDASWERDLWGMKLGITVMSIRNRDAYAELRPELEEMGFDYDPQLILHEWDKVKRALLAYKDMFGNLLMPAKFIIPDSSSWEPDLWGVKLGSEVNQIRNRGDHCKDHMQELEEMGFDFSSQRGKCG